MESIFLVAVPLLIVVSIAEAVVSGRWRPSYFRSGITVYRRELRANRELTVDTAELERQFGQSVGPAILFRKLGVGEYGFREKMLDFRRFRFNYSPVMHGYISIRGTTGVLLGRLNWASSLIAILGIGVLGWLVRDTGEVGFVASFMLGCLVFILASIYAVQRHRFNSIAQSIEQGGAVTQR